MPARAAVLALVLGFAVPALAQKPDPAPRPEPEWSVLKPAKAESAGGATLTVEEDGTVAAGGAIPDTDTMTFEASSDLRGITGIRFEVFPWEGGKGPGFHPNGNFVLSTIKVHSASRLSPGAWKPVPFATARASWSQTGFDVRQAVDAEPSSGWSILPRSGKPSTAVFEVQRPVDYEAGAVLRIVLEFAFGSRHIPGRFRFAATAAERPLPAPPDPEDLGAGALQTKINRSIDRGVAWLLRQQYLDGSWRDHCDGYPAGQTALGAYTLMKCGLPPRHGAVRRAVEYLKAHPDRKTYSTSCVILALCAQDPKAHKPWIQGLVSDLLSWQRDGFGYPDGAVDLSNTQYAALALRAAALNGIPVSPKVWLGLQAQVLKCQEKIENAYSSAGFSYHPGGAASGSMTAAGVGILAICEEQLKRVSQEASASKKAGLAWLAKHFSASSNMVPGQKANEEWIVYWLYGVERVAAFEKLDRFGEHAWYPEGAEWLTTVQDGDGGWGWARQTSTCFALLFLTKATASVTAPRHGPADAAGEGAAEDLVFLKTSGDTPMALWIPRFGERAVRAYEWLDDAGKGLRVRSVTYLAARANDPTAFVPVASVPGDPGRPHGTATFACNHAFSAPGRWWVKARVEVQLPGVDPKDEASFQVVESAPAQVAVHDLQTPELLGWAGDAARNLITAAPGAKAEASSEWHDKAWKPAYALDGLQARCWLSNDGDPRPSITITPAAPVRANTLLLSHATLPWDTTFTARVQRASVAINGDGTPIEFAMDPDDQRKTVVPLGKAVLVRSLVIRVLESRQGPGNHDACGFAEVELQLRTAEKR